MAFAALSGPLLYGAPWKAGLNWGYYAENVLNGTGQRIGYIFQAPKTGTLDRFGLRLIGVGQAPTAGIKFSFQDLSAGNPDGGADQFAIVTAGITAGAWLEPATYLGSTGLGSGTKRAVAVGDWLACVIEFAAFNAGDSVSPSFWDWYQIGGQYDTGSTWHAKFNGSSWARDQTPAHIALRYDDGTYGYISPNWWPVLTLNATAYNSASSPDEIGIVFQVPAKVQLSGCSFIHAISTDATLVLYDSNGTTVLASQPVLAANGFNASLNAPKWIYFNAPIALLANTAYRLVLKPGPSNITLYDVTVPAAPYLGGFEGGASIYRTQRTDAGAWTDTNTRRPVMGLIISGIDDGGGGAAAAGGSYGFA